MYLKQLLIVVLIGVLSLRDDVGMCVGSIAHAASLAHLDRSDQYEAVDEDGWEGDLEQDFDDANPDPENDSLPAERESLPGVPDGSDESDTEEKCSVESKLDSESVRLHFSIETDRSVGQFVDSRPLTIRLRI